MPNDEPNIRVIDRKEIQATWNSKADERRRKLIKELLRIYTHQWRGDLEQKISERFLEQNAEKLRARADTSLNLLHWVANEIGSIYSQPAMRSINESSDGLEPYTSDGRIDHFFDAACRHTFVCRELAMRPMMSGGRVILDLVTPDRFTVVPHADDPEKFDAIVVQVDRSLKQKYAVWTTEEQFYCDAEFQVHEPAVPNAYGRIPYVVAHANFPAMTFFNERDILGLRDATYEAAVKMTDHNHLRHLQSFKQGFIAGTSDEKIGRLATDPSTWMVFSDPATRVGTLDMQANLETHLETLFQSIRPVLLTYGVWADAVRGKMDTNSGYGLSLKMHKQQVEWRKQRVLWRTYERQVYELARVVAQADAKITLPDGLLDIDYPDIGPKSNPQEQATLAESLGRVGMSRENIWREVYGKDDDWIERNEAELVEQEARDNPMIPGSDPDFGGGEE